MKFRRWEQVLRETTVELSVDFPTALERLQQLQGVCRDTPSDQQQLVFLCTEKGRLFITESNRKRMERLYTVRGEVYVEDGITKATVYEIHDRFAKYLNIFFIILSVVVYALMILLDFDLLTPLSPHNLLILALPLLVLLAMALPMWTQKKNKESDLIIQRDELLRRLEAVERWDD